jgi:hypothetical protein
VCPAVATPQRRSKARLETYRHVRRVRRQPRSKPPTAIEEILVAMLDVVMLDESAARSV